MKVHKSLKHAFNMVLHSKLRSWLTILGIVIGVASVIAIVALGDGMQASVESQFNGKGADLLTVTAGAARGGGFGGGGGGGDNGGGGGASTTNVTPQLTDSDVQTIRGVSGIGSIDTQISGRVTIYYLGQTGSVNVNGVDQSVWSQMNQPVINQGRTLSTADTNVVLIGGRLGSGYFDRPVGISSTITLDGKAFRVIGITNDSSTTIYMPINMAYQVLSDKNRGVYDKIVIQVKDPTLVAETANVTREALAIKRHVIGKKQDFSISDPSAQLATRQQMLSSITMFLTAIAAVALIVGAVGIANTMFTSVLEKTKQIGIMKAIGATRQDILLIFLFNAALIGLIGGLIGVIFGYLLAQVLPMFISIGPVRGTTIAIVRLSTILMALGVSVGIGVIAGAVPAWSASKLKPVDALRYE